MRGWSSRLKRERSSAWPVPAIVRRASRSAISRRRRPCTSGPRPGLRPARWPGRRRRRRDGPQGGEVALNLEAVPRRPVAPVPGLEREPLRRHVGVEVVRRHQLVLGAVDELDEVAEGPAPLVVVDERQVRADVPEEQHLADAVEDVGPRGQAGVGRGFGEDALAEAVEVGDRDPRPRRAADRLVQAFLQLPRRLDVVGQDEELFRQEAARRSRKYRTRSMITRVLPAPAPAITTSGPSPYSTMRRCSAVSWSVTLRPLPVSGSGSEPGASIVALIALIGKHGELVLVLVLPVHAGVADLVGLVHLVGAGTPARALVALVLVKHDTGGDGEPERRREVERVAPGRTGRPSRSADPLSLPGRPSGWPASGARARSSNGRARWSSRRRPRRQPAKLRTGTGARSGGSLLHVTEEWTAVAVQLGGVTVATTGSRRSLVSSGSCDRRPHSQLQLPVRATAPVCMKGTRAPAYAGAQRRAGSRATLLPPPLTGCHL